MYPDLSLNVPQSPENLQGAVRAESRLGEGEAVATRHRRTVEAHAQVLPQPLRLSVDVGHSVTEFELQRVRLVGSASG